MDKPSFSFCTDPYGNPEEVPPLMLSPEAVLAMKLLEQWGMATAESTGEDSAGRAKIALVSPGNLVTRAFDIATAFFAEARARGMVADRQAAYAAWAAKKAKKGKS